MLCPKCKKEILEDSKFCPFCGADLSAAATPEDTRTASPAEPVAQQNVQEPAAAEAASVEQTTAPAAETATPAKKARSKKPLINTVKKDFINETYDGTVVVGRAAGVLRLRCSVERRRYDFYVWRM